jgi:hypothetical protein
MSKISSTSCGASPKDGSSRRIMRGRDISARPIARHLLLAAGGIAGLGITAVLEAGEIAVDQFEIGLDGGRPVAARIGAGQEILLDGQMLEAVAALHDLDDAAAHQFVGRQALDPVALNKWFPW